MPQYAAGGIMDKVNVPKKQGNNRINMIIKIAVVIIVLVLLFGANFSSQQIQLTNKTTKQIYDTNEVQINFTMKNTTIGMLFNPYCIINITDDSGKTLYSDTVNACKILVPLGSVDIQTVIPYYSEQEANLSVEWQCRGIKFN